MPSPRASGATHMRLISPVEALSGFSPPHPTARPRRRATTKVLAASDYASYDPVVKHRAWNQRRIDFQPFPYPSYTEQLVRSLRETRIDGDSAFLEKLDPAFAARDLVDDRFVRKALAKVGGLGAFGLPADFARQEVLAP